MLAGLDGWLTPVSLMARTRLYRVVGIAGLLRAGVLLGHRELGAVPILPLRRDSIFVQESLFFHSSRCKRLQMQALVLKAKKIKPLMSSTFSLRPAGFPHYQRRSQGYLPRRLLPFKLFQHQLHRRLGNRLVGCCQGRQCRPLISPQVEITAAYYSYILGLARCHLEVLKLLFIYLGTSNHRSSVSLRTKTPSGVASRYR